MSRSLLVVLLLGSWVRVQAPAEPKVGLEKLGTILTAARTKHKVPAMAVAVVTSKGLHAMSYQGVRKAGTTIGITEDDRWHLGSDTKAFTAMLLAVLAEQGKLDYDMTMPRLMPSLAAGMPADYKEVTLDQLLRHRSGMPHQLKDWWAIKTGTLRQQRITALKQGLAMKPVAKPGTETHYSNLAFLYAAASAERVMDAPWEELVTKHVLKPLDIKTAGFGPVGTVGKADQPLGHDSKGKPREPVIGNDSPPVLGPATRLHMSLKDWAAFAQDQLNGAKGKGKLLKPEGYKKLHSSEKGQEYTPGGWSVDLSAGFVVLTHSGSNQVFYCTAALIPSMDMGVLVVCNQGPPAGEAAVKEVTLAALRAALTGM